MTDNTEIKNAQIESTSLGPEGHGILTCWLHVTYNGTGQGFGGYAFDGYDKEKKCRYCTAFGMEYIRRLLEVTGVDYWEKLVGTYIRVRVRGESLLNEKIVAIGHITKDKWFEPAIDLQHLMK